MQNLYTVIHNIGFCFYTIPSLLIGAVMAVTAVMHNKKQKDREKDFEKEIKG